VKKGGEEMTGAYGMMRCAMMVVFMALCCLALVWPAAAVETTVEAPTFINGQTLERVCYGSNDKDAGICLGYILGVADMSETLVLAGKLVGGGKRSFCLTDVTAGQAVNVVKLWLNDHPESRGWSGDLAVWSAFKEKFPCN
jgi:hypothetical protein